MILAPVMLREAAEKREREIHIITDGQALPWASFGTENAPGATMCSQCGAMFGAREGMVQRIYREGGPKLVIRSMVIGNLSLLLAIYLMLTLPAIIAGPIVLAGVLVGAWLFMRWVGGDLGVIEH